MLLLAYVEGEWRNGVAVHSGGSARPAVASPLDLAVVFSAATIPKTPSSYFLKVESLAGSTMPKLSTIDKLMLKLRGVWTMKGRVISMIESSSRLEARKN
jgi:hypothetical protein